MVEKGYSTPTITVECVEIPKPEDKWSEEEMKSVTLNAKAMNALACALCPEEFNIVFTCKISNYIWDTLEVTHECTNQVKEAKIDILTHQYDLFKMKSDETIKDMYTRFTNIKNGFKSFKNLI